MSRLTTDITFDDKVHQKIESGFSKLYNLAKASYGPTAGNSILEYPYGDSILSRDGVTNMKRVKLEDGIEDSTIKIATQASAHSEESVGDGTTAAVILAYHLYKAGRKLVGAGYNQMEVSRKITKAAEQAVEQIDELKIPLNPKLLKYVATTSSGEEAIGDMIADIVSEVGEDGGITIEDFMGRGLSSEIVDGFYFRKGLVSSYLAKDPTNMESRHLNAPILICDKRMVSQADIAHIIDQVMSNFKELIIVGSVDGEALALIVNLRLQNKLMVSIVDPPYEARPLFLEDLATLTGGTIITEGLNPLDFSSEMLGFAQKVVITTQTTAIIGSDGATEDVEARLADLHDQLMEATHPTDIQVIKDRLSRLRGKVAIIRVGGSTEAEQAEVKLRVQDAVCAAQAALKDGIVPGGGVMLARLEVDFKEAFEQPFKQLAENSGLNAEALLARLEDTDPWTGFDLKEITKEPVHLLKAGVLDPALVVKEVVLNAASVASRLITTSSAVTLQNREEKKD